MRKVERKRLNEVVVGIQDPLDIGPGWFFGGKLLDHQTLKLGPQKALV